MSSEAAFVAQLKKQAKAFLDPEGGGCLVPKSAELDDGDGPLCCAVPPFAFDCSLGPHRRRAVCSPAGQATVAEGAVVFRNAAYAWCLSQDFIASHCSCCMTRVSEPLQCTRCKHTRYCSKACQSQDWTEGGHSKECKHLATLRFPSPQVNDMRLLVRTYYTTFMRKKKRSDCRKSVSGGAVDCGTRHLRALSTAAGVPDYRARHDGTAERAAADDILLQAAFILSQPPEKEEVNFLELCNLFAAFATNNFGILDDLFQVVGTGVYPLSALLNHSCSPNILLVYPKSLQAGPPLSLGIALSPLLRGMDDELTHSYVDMCHPVQLRRQKLFESHNFICACARCREQMSIYEQVDWSWSKEEDALGKELERLVDEPALLQAALERSKTTTARALRLHALVERLVTSPKGRLNYELYKINCAHFEESLFCAGQEGADSEALQDAIRLCKRIVSSLCVYFSHVSFHPLLGLQLFTLGDLLSASPSSGHREEAKAMYDWCARQLKHSHDSSSSGSDMLTRLKQMRDELGN